MLIVSCQKVKYHHNIITVDESISLPLNNRGSIQSTKECPHASIDQLDFCPIVEHIGGKWNQTFAPWKSNHTWWCLRRLQGRHISVIKWKFCCEMSTARGNGLDFSFICHITWLVEGRVQNLNHIWEKITCLEMAASGGKNILPFPMNFTYECKWYAS